jgi:hypothetical protein
MHSSFLGGGFLSDTPDPNSTEKLPVEPSVVSDAGPARAAPLPTSIRTDRKHLLIWVAIGFLLPGLIVIALHPVITRGSSGFSVRTELSTKAIMAIFVVSATWIVSRMEKRPLDDYGLPLRQAFGLRFWEGAVWGFAMLSAVLLVLYLLGNFPIDSVALKGSAALRYAIGWGAVFLAVSINEEFAFRGYWLFHFPGEYASGRLRYFCRASLPVRI